MPLTVNLVSATATQLTLELLANPAGTYRLEMNRAADFASDVTLFVDVAAGASTQVVIPGLPNGTPFHIRGRLVNGTGGYGNTLLAATAEVAPAGYTGFAIDKAALVIPAALADLAVGYTGGAAAIAGFPVTNLRSDDPQATWQYSGTGTATITFTTSGEPIDTVSILGTMIGDDATWTVSSTPVAGNFGANGSTTSGSVQMRCSPTLGRRLAYHALHQLPAPTTNRFWRIQIVSGARHTLARNLVAGLSRASINAAAGNSFSMSDQTAIQRTRFGGLDTVPGWRGRVIDFDMQWLTEAEYHAKWAALPGIVGRGVSVLAMPNSKRNVHLNDRIAFGPATTIRSETLRGTKHSQSIEIDSNY
jgi:hypothetical protein